MRGALVAMSASVWLTAGTPRRRARLEIVHQHACEQDQIGDQQQAHAVAGEEWQRHDHADDDKCSDDGGDEEGLAPRRAQMNIHWSPLFATLPRTKARLGKSNGKAPPLPCAQICPLEPNF